MTAPPRLSCTNGTAQVGASESLVGVRRGRETGPIEGGTRTARRCGGDGTTDEVRRAREEAWLDSEPSQGAS
jgi:hypothetical protein